MTCIIRNWSRGSFQLLSKTRGRLSPGARRQSRKRRPRTTDVSRQETAAAAAAADTTVTLHTGATDTANARTTSEAVPAARRRGFRICVRSTPDRKRNVIQLITGARQPKGFRIVPGASRRTQLHFRTENELFTVLAIGFSCAIARASGGRIGGSEVEEWEEEEEINGNDRLKRPRAIKTPVALGETSYAAGTATLYNSCTVKRIFQCRTRTVCVPIRRETVVLSWTYERFPTPPQLKAYFN